MPARPSQADVQRATFNVQERIEFALNEGNEINTSLNSNVIQLITREEDLLEQANQQNNILIYNYYDIVRQYQNLNMDSILHLVEVKFEQK